MNKNLLKLVSSLFVALVLLVSSSSYADDVEAPKNENTSEENTTQPAPLGEEEEKSCGCKAFSFIAAADLEDQKTSDESSNSSSDESSESSSGESSETTSTTSSTDE